MARLLVPCPETAVSWVVGLAAPVVFGMKGRSNSSIFSIWWIFLVLVAFITEKHFWLLKVRGCCFEMKALYTWWRKNPDLWGGSYAGASQFAALTLAKFLLLQKCHWNLTHTVVWTSIVPFSWKKNCSRKLFCFCFNFSLGYRNLIDPVTSKVLRSFINFVTIICFLLVQFVRAGPAKDMYIDHKKNQS